MSKHTPGPWFVYGKTEIVTTNGVVVASASWMRNEEEEIPNARLIAAAPDLLDALNGLLTLHENVDFTCDDDWNAARAAIAKATGDNA